jgi:chitin disaccharide deacetylase
MLIVNADDWGKNETTTNNIICCFLSDRITSTSAMVFMVDSERAAEIALSHRPDVGLHINFTERFTKNTAGPRLNEYHNNIASFLLRNKFSMLIYNPLLRDQFKYVFEHQYDEFVRLYGYTPSHIDGHKHMHLCSNMLIDTIISPGFKVRKSFTFQGDEKDMFNRAYRYVLNKWLGHRYITTDFFFALSPARLYNKLPEIFNLATSTDVELMAHPELQDEHEFLMSHEYESLLGTTKRGNYQNLL